jgi:RNA polymerase primary sigma factor
VRDSVGVWLEGAGRTKLLTAAEEVELARKVREWLDFEGGPDRAPVRVRWVGRRAKEQMVAANLRLVMSVAQRFAWATRDGGALGLEDLLQEGTLG